MCGIAGIWRPDGPPVAPDEIAPALRAMRHRGPDADGMWFGGHAGLGVCRLAVIDPAGGAQPMEAPGGKGVLAWNGELHDYRERRRGLERQGPPFRTASDTEVFLRTLIAEPRLLRPGRLFPRPVSRWDVSFSLLDAHAMFAAAVAVNEGTRGLLIRDRAGVKPLLFRRVAGALGFASELGALLEMGGERRLDLAALTERLSFQVRTGEPTLVEGVRDLAPGYAIVLDLASGEPENWEWSRRPGTENEVPEAEWVQGIRETLGLAIRETMRSDVPVGVTLSGGLDSSIVAALAAREAGERLPAFCGYFEDGSEFDERPFARKVAEEVGLELIEVPVRPEDLLRLLPELAVALEGPIAGPGAFPQMVVAEAAAERVTVLLTGQGADEVFLGYARNRIAWRAAAGRLDPGALPPGLESYGPLVTHLLTGGPATSFDDIWFRLVHRGGGAEEVAGPVLREALAAYDPRARFDQMMAALDAQERHSALLPDGTVDPRRRMAAWERRHVLPALLHVEDRVTMRRSLESRVPLLHPRLLDYGFQIPPDIAFGDGESKRILRRAAEGIVPASVLSRTDKMGFPVPLAKWAAGPLREPLLKRLKEGPLIDAGLLAEDAPAKLVDGPGGHGRHLWFFLILSEWMAGTGITV